MRVKGRMVQPPKPVVVVIPRSQDGSEDIVFYCGSVLDFSEFDKLVPEPLPGTITITGQDPKPDYDAPGYLAKKAKYALLKWNWFELTSLRSTPDLEWDTVNYNDPETWGNYEKELRDSGLTIFEINALKAGINEANNMDEKRMREARDRFVRTQAEQKS